MPRVVIPGVPHHVTQRGNRRQRTFFNEADFAAYVHLLRHFSDAAGLAIWAWCLMPNHVHLVVAPAVENSLCRGLSETHRRYTLRIHRREDWRGYLWQGRFASFPMDEAHMLCAVRYVELNPVRAGLVPRAEDWRWSSAPARLGTADRDPLITPGPVEEMVSDWASYLEAPQPEAVDETIRKHQRTGRPLGSTSFVARLESQTGRTLSPQRRGRRPRS